MDEIREWQDREVRKLKCFYLAGEMDGEEFMSRIGGLRTAVFVCRRNPARAKEFVHLGEEVRDTK